MKKKWSEMLRDTIMRFKPKIVGKKISVEYDLTRFLTTYKNPVLFENVNGSRLIGNLWDRERIATALNTTKEKLLHKMLTAIEKPQKLKFVKNAPLLENCISGNRLNLYNLPIPKWYPKDGGRYVTGGVVIAEYDGKINASFHRLMLLNEKQFAIRLVPRHLYRMYETALAANIELEICIVISAYADVLLAAGMPVPYETNELEVASAIRQNTFSKPLEAVKLGNLPVPAEAEYALLGKITKNQSEEGPFVDITGTYDKVRLQPIVEIEKIYFRNQPIFHAILPGGEEHYAFMGMPREPFIYRSVAGVVSKVYGVRLTEGSCSWLHGVISIEKTREGDGKNALLAAFAGHPSMKKAIVVDGDIDIFDDKAVEWAVATRFQGSNDLIVIKNATGSSLDPSADENMTTKIGFDATKPLKKRAVFEKATL